MNLSRKTSQTMENLSEQTVEADPSEIEKSLYGVILRSLISHGFLLGSFPIRLPFLDVQTANHVIYGTIISSIPFIACEILNNENKKIKNFCISFGLSSSILFFRYAHINNLELSQDQEQVQKELTNLAFMLTPFVAVSGASMMDWIAKKSEYVKSIRDKFSLVLGKYL